MSVNKILFIDLEHNGFGDRRIIELGMVVTDSKGKELSIASYLIKPNGWTIPDKDFWIKAGFNQEQSEATGVPIATALLDLLRELDACDLIVCHNAEHDLPIITRELYKEGFKPEILKPALCTMQLSSRLSLEKLYQSLFNKPIEIPHRALKDAIITKDCFFEMVRIGRIRLT